MPTLRMIFATGVLLCLFPQPGKAQGPELEIAVTGPPVVVFDHARDACEAWDIPDAPARAVRTSDHQVLMFATHFRNRVLHGPDLNHVRPNCQVVFAGAEADDPAAFDDRGWLAAPYTEDGVSIYSVVHDEFQGHRRPALCPSGHYMDCWYNTLTSAVSHDSGAHFVRVPGLVAALPYRYDEVRGEHRGYFNPSNIVPIDGHHAMMMFTTAAFAQLPGNCLLRTDQVENPGAWRGWDGAGFTIRFIDPYREHDDARAHVCAPVGSGRLRWPVTSLVRHRPSGRFIATMENASADGGVFVATSADLVTWSEPARILFVTGEAAWHCGEPAPIAYPSILDPASTDFSFATVGARPVLFLTRFNAHGCDLGPDRDLVRLDLAISPSDRR
jgi:hypothetical protein